MPHEPADPRAPGLRHTLDFFASHLPPAPARILEVGAGDGALAALLVRRGYDVVAIEPDEESAATARERGVQVVDAAFFACEPAGAFDVVTFTRSLHHIHPLPDAIAHAARFLRDDGRLVLEEVALEAPAREDARWFYDVTGALAAAGLLREDVAERLREREDLDPLDAWRLQHEHDPPLHTGDAMTAAVRERFDVERIELAPYLYRYVSYWIERTARGMATAEAVARAERRRVFEGVTRAIGLRVVARPRR
jgi:SAM-dependent methyltransferase